MIKKQTLVRIFAASLVILLVCLPLLPTIRANAAKTEIDFYQGRYDTSVSLPYSASHSFDHAAELSTANEHTLTFYAEAGRSVSLYFGRGVCKTSVTKSEEQGESDEQYSYSAVSAQIYTDTGSSIHSAICDKYTDSSHLTFLPSYSGIYYLSLVSRSSVGGEYVCSYSLSQSKEAKSNSIKSYPHNKGYSKNTHKTSKVSALFDKEYYSDTDYLVSIFEIDHEASSIFSYSVTVPAGAKSAYCILYRFSGDTYSTHVSSASNEYDAGGAYEMYYSGRSYLLVFSEGAFDLSADMLTHNDYTVTKISSSHKGMLDASDSVLLYDSEKFDSIVSRFPFSDIKNRYVKFFEINTDKNSVVTLYYDRRDHSYFTAVSGELGLSHSSKYPARLFGEYCSESTPTELCYASYITDSGKLYLCYTGTDPSAYVEIKSDAAFTLDTVYEESYHPNDPLPVTSISGIYSDLSFFTDSGIVESVSTVHKISGYMFVSENGDKTYYTADSSLVAPGRNGVYSLYVIIDCAYTFTGSGNNSAVHKYYSLNMGQITVKSIFSLPGIITNLGNAVGISSPLLSLLLFCALGIAVIIAILYLLLCLKKKKLVAINRKELSSGISKSLNGAIKTRKRPTNKIEFKGNDNDPSQKGDGE